MDAPSKRIIAEKYEVRGLLGEGGTGIVYDAIRTEDQRAVALKVMHAALAGDKQIRGRFQREAQILRRLEGNHVCPILDFGEVPGEEAGTTLLYIALPKIDGESLAEELARGPIDVDRALDVQLQVLEALSSAHAQGIIHRDLKPANVLLDRRAPASPKAVVVDFGMSKIITGSGMGTTNLTTHNMVFGTPEYMSPEQARGDDLDGRCDVYAAGVMLYEMLTGGPPFTGPTPLSVLTAHLTSEIEPPSTRPGAVGRVTPALEAVILRALARDREQRFASAEAFAEAIRAARAAPDEKPAAPQATPEAFAKTLPAGNSVPAVVDAIAPTLHGGGPIAPGTQPLPRRITATSPERAPPSRAPASSGTSKGWILAWIVVGLLSIAIGVYLALRA